MNTKYTPEILLPALRLFIKARNLANDVGVADNGGAIHSVERILDVLSVRLKYGLSHVNQLKVAANAECSTGAHLARQRGEKVFIEHVLPQRAFARTIISLIDNGASDADVIDYIQSHYPLVLLSTQETTQLNRQNRSLISPHRLEDAGIVIQSEGATP